MRKSPTPSKDYIIKIKKGTKVEVLDIVDGYYKIKYKNNVGYINNIYLYDPALNKIAEEMKKDEQRQNEINKGLIKDKKHAKLIEKYGSLSAARIARHQVWLGMSDEMAIESRGRPDKVNRTSGTWGIHEQWVYDKEDVYLYFENGKLTTIQD